MSLELNCDRSRYLLVGGAGEEFLLAVFLLNYALLHVHRDVNDVFDLEEDGEEGFDLRLFVRAEDVGDDEPLTAAHLFALDVRRLVLLICRLAQKFAHLVQEAILVAQLAPRLNAQDQVKAPFT